MAMFIGLDVAVVCTLFFFQVVDGSQEVFAKPLEQVNVETPFSPQALAQGFDLVSRRSF